MRKLACLLFLPLLAACGNGGPNIFPTVGYVSVLGAPLAGGQMRILNDIDGARCEVFRDGAEVYRQGESRQVSLLIGEDVRSERGLYQGWVEARCFQRGGVFVAKVRYDLGCSKTVLLSGNQQCHNNSGYSRF